MCDSAADKVADAVSQPVRINVVPSRSSAILTSSRVSDFRPGSGIKANDLPWVDHLVPFLGRAHNSISYDFANIDQRDLPRVAALFHDGANGA